MKIENKRTFDTEVDGKSVKFVVKRPDNAALGKAQLYHNKAFREAIDNKAIVRARVEDVMREQGLWDDTKRTEFERLSKNVLLSTKKLKEGGIKLIEARDIAIQMRRDRYALRQLSQKRDELDLYTAEAQAENARFNYLVSACTLYESTGKPYWNSYEEYLKRENDPVSPMAAGALSRLIYDLDDDFDKKLPENAFLLTHKFVNDKLHLVNKEGNLINVDGKRINEDGFFVNEKGEPIDSDGNLLTKEGDYIVETKPFLDDDGNPLAEEKKEEVALATV